MQKNAKSYFFKSFVIVDIFSSYLFMANFIFCSTKTFSINSTNYVILAMKTICTFLTLEVGNDIYTA